MNSFQHFTTIAELDCFIDSHTFTFVYIGQQNCSVCHGLLPQVKQLLHAFPQIKQAYVETNELPEIAGHLSIFTVPVLILFIEGKESIREARIVHLDLLKQKISSLYDAFYPS